MHLLTLSPDLSRVTDCLSNGWEFLSGDRSTFALAADAGTPVRHAEFCFFLPLSGRDNESAGAVGVLIEGDDAQQVAANMFGKDADHMELHNQSDACAEACNVLAECVVHNITQQANITIGLPFNADALMYQDICHNCTPAAIYQCQTKTGQLFVIAYETFK